MEPLIGMVVVVLIAYGIAKLIKMDLESFGTTSNDNTIRDIKDFFSYKAK